MAQGKPTSRDIEHLITELMLPFYQTERDLPLPIPSRRNENDAEHSWSVALVACALAPGIDAKLDVGKVCQFGVVHDLTERYAGDTSVYATDHHLNSKEEREAAALRRIEQEFAHFSWITETLATYERQDSREAQFVKAVDKVVALWIDYLEDGGYYRKHKLTKDVFLKIRDNHRKKAAKFAEILPYYDEIYEKILNNPNHFHKKTRDQ